MSDRRVSSILELQDSEIHSRARIGFETARLRLAEIKNEGKDARLLACRVACEQSARTLGVERVSIWMLTPDRSAIECSLQYSLSNNEFSEGGTILRSAAARYFEAVVSKRVIVVPDAHTDPITTQLSQYLHEAGVGALLDAPIYRDGEVIGVVCHEHVGGARKWSDREAGFASAVADMLTILIEQAERAELRAAIDAQRQLEAQNQKMQALVNLARVVTHDLSNLLTIATLRAGSLPEESDINSASEEMSHVLGYGNQLLRHLKDFCDERTPTENVLVRACVLELEPVIHALLGKDIEFSLVPPEEEVTLAISRVELEQVIMNLIGNAQDASDGHSKIQLKFWTEGADLHLEVADTGRGMSPLTQSRLFEPFFSTKDGHSGIGLAAVYGIVQRSNGRIDLRSALGEGTTFHLVFPIRSASRAAPDTFPWDL